LIIRVLHEGQYEVEGEALHVVDSLDGQIFEAVADGDRDRYQQLFTQVLDTIRKGGKPLALDDLRGSQLILPAPDSTFEEVRSLFEQQGMVASE
jgi:hypothetical protein